jgi:hypothetical protein
MYGIGALVGATVAMFLLGRLCQWLLKNMGDTAIRVLAAYAVALAFATVAAGYGFSAPDGTPNFAFSFMTYGAPAAVWLAVDLLSWHRRKAKQGAP